MTNATEMTLTALCVHMPTPSFSFFYGFGYFSYHNISYVTFRAAFVAIKPNTSVKAEAITHNKC